MYSLIVQRWLGTIVRYGVFALGEWLRHHGFLSDAEVSQFVSNETIETIVAWLVMAAPVLWSMRGKVTNLRELVAALRLRPGATLTEVQTLAAQPHIKATSIAKT